MRALAAAGSAVAGGAQQMGARSGLDPLEKNSVPSVRPPQVSNILDVHLPPVHFAAKIDSKRDFSDMSAFHCGSTAGHVVGFNVEKTSKTLSSQTRKVA